MLNAKLERLIDMLETLEPGKSATDEIWFAIGFCKEIATQIQIDYEVENVQRNQSVPV